MELTRAMSNAKLVNECSEVDWLRVRSVLVWVVAVTAMAMLGAGRSADAEDRSSLTVRLAEVLEEIDGGEHPHLHGYVEAVLSRLRDGEGPPQPYLAAQADGTAREVALAATLAQDITSAGADSPWRGKKLAGYVVPALSSIPRMPDAVPSDGEICNRVRLAGARGEYVPGSFVVAPLAPVDELVLEASSLQSGSGRIPAEALDLKVVKAWYQAGTAWHSYFADPTQRELVPELLLNDETLIKVDHQRRQNYVRVDYPEGSQYVWVSAPPEVSDGAFDHHTEPVSDADTLRPISLHPGEMRQFWLTVRIPENTAPGVYEGAVTLRADGADVGVFEVSLRVLPFELPNPRTYHDLERDFHVFIYNNASLHNHLQGTGGNWDLAERKLLAELENLRAHNAINQHLPGRIVPRPWNWDVTDDHRRVYRRNLELIAEAGLRPPLFDGFFAALEPGWMAQNPEQRDPQRLEAFKAAAAESLDMIEEVLGHRHVYFFGWDEPPRSILINQRVAWETLHKLGARIYATSRVGHFEHAGYRENIANYGGFNYTRERATRIHSLGHRVMSYAGPHTGPENPAYSRRTHGMALYKAWYDGSGNYRYYSQWNDFAGGAFRGFNMVYPTQTGVIDTLAWEGFREGIDDIRYATKLKQLAEQAMDSGDIALEYSAKQALVWLESHDERRGDLDAMRLEMVRYILELMDKLAGVE